MKTISSPRRTLENPRRPGMVTALTPAQLEAFSVSLGEDAATLGLALSPTQVRAQLALLHHLLHWNALINLSAVIEPEAMLSVHILDSLAALPVVLPHLKASPAPRILDVGTGAGLPAIPWALVLAERVPTAQIVAIDAVRKKIHTIHDFIEKEKLTNLKAHHTRIEDFTSEFDVVTSRAFASLKNFATLAGPRVRAGGVILALKGKMPTDEIDELAGTQWEVAKVTPLVVPRLHADRCVVELRRK